MTPEGRKSLAEQLMANQLFTEMLDTQETQAIDRMVYAPDEQTRLEGALRVKAVRSLREDCLSFIDDNDQQRRAAPA